MSVERDPSGRRYIDTEVEVPGTPEEVWQAIATDSGISSWFVPAKVEGREGGTIAFFEAQEQEAASSGEVTVWDPPRVFAYEDDWPLAGSSVVGRLATEFHVEAVDGGTCIVRVVSSLFASGDEWDEQLETTRTGWGGYLEILRIVLTYFQGEHCAMFYVRGCVPGSQGSALADVLAALGLSAASKGEHVIVTSSGAPSFSGIVEHINDHGLTIRLESPVRGIGTIQVYAWAGQVFVTFQARIYGNDASAASQYQAQWQAWIDEHFPAHQAIAETTSE